MRSSRKLWSGGVAGVLILCLLVLSSCNLPGGAATPTQVPPDVYYTQAAETIDANLTVTAAAQPTVTLTPQPPTEIPTLTPTITPVVTATSAFPLISADVGTNCRLGPSTIYDPPVGMLMPGQSSEVRGRNDTSTWWYIANPGKAGQFCWIWGETTKVTGDVSNLPVITPPPPPPTATPTATAGALYSVSFDNVHACNETPTGIFKVANTGTVNWHSVTLKIDDLTDNVVLFGPESNDAPFLGTNTECPYGGDLLKVGATAYIGGAVGENNSGHSARATIRLCTQNGPSGTCVDKIVDFTIP
jgi:hypothetical protein